MNATIVITGASSGLGRGTAITLASLGANVVLAARGTAALEELSAEIAAAGGSVLAVPTDVSDPGDVVRLSTLSAEYFGRIDVWINNAGIGALGPFWDIPIEDHARIIDVNLKGLIYGAHEALRHFRVQGFGILINIGSIVSEVPIAYHASYAASKAAVLSLSRSLHEELRLAGNINIKVGTIMPWAVDTPWWTNAANYSGHATRMATMDDPQIVINAIVEACTNPKVKQPVGWKARATKISHHLFPNITERLSGNISHQEINKANETPHSVGSIYKPTVEAGKISGGIRERMSRENIDKT